MLVFKLCLILCLLQFQQLLALIQFLHLLHQSLFLQALQVLQQDAVPAGITNSAVGLKICPITAGNKKYKSIIKKSKRKHDKIVLLGKTKLDAIEVLISKALIDSCITHDEFVSVNNVLREYNEMKQEIKILKRLQKTPYNYG